MRLISILPPALAAALLAAAPLAAQTGDAVPIEIGIIRVEHERPLPLARVDLPPEDLGLAGARLAIGDNNTTGAFMGQSFELTEVVVPPADAVAAMQDLVAGGARFIATLADGETTLALAAAAGDETVVLNALAPDDRLRGEDCRANLLHIAPSRSMMADAVAQFLVFKRWGDWFLIEGSHPEDAELAAAYRRAADKFGARIVEERVYADTGGSRQTDSGHVQVQAQLPVFTQRAAEHHVVIAADENEVFSTYLPYHTWEPRPVAGSAGLKPMTWHPSLEAWGGAQLQSRFEKAAGRPMRPEDYNVWLAIRALGEAATRTNSSDPATLKEYLLGDAFQIAAFKGQPLTFRDWDGQMRQPILLAAGPIVVSVSPQDEFLHQFSPLDTLGTDRPETACRLDG